MRAPTIILVGIFASAAVSLVASELPPVRLQQTSPSAAAVHVFEHARVLPMDGRGALENQSVVVIGERIVGVGPHGTLPIPSNARRIEARGLTLMPGLADMHVHLYSEGDLFNYLANGVTSVLDLNGSARVRGWRESVRFGLLEGPTIYASGPSLNGYPPGNPSFVSLTDSTEAAFEVRRQAAAGYDVIKAYSTLSPPVFRAVARTAAELDIGVVGHVPLQLGLEPSVAAGLDMVAHGEEYWKVLEGDSAGIAPAVGATRAAGVWVTPNLSAIDRIMDEAARLPDLMDDAEAAYMSPAAYSEWMPSNNRYWGRDTAEVLPLFRREGRFIRRVTLELSRGGVPLLLGTDSPVFGYAGRSAHRELELLVEAGLSPHEALRAATRSAGDFAQAVLGVEERFGRVVPGYRADLLLVAGDPLTDVADVARLQGVMARGRWFTAETIEDRRESSGEANRVLRSRVGRVDSLFTASDPEAALAALDTLRSLEAGGVASVAEIVWWRWGATLLRGHPADASAARRLFGEMSRAFPASHVPWIGLADSRVAAGDTTGALRALASAHELVPSHAGVTDRRLRLLAGRIPPRFEPAGVYRLHTRARVEGELRDVELVLTLTTEGGEYGGRIETDTPIPVLQVNEVIASGSRLWVSAPVGGSALDLRLAVEGRDVAGSWNLGSSEQGHLRGIRQDSP